MASFDNIPLPDEEDYAEDDAPTCPICDKHPISIDVVRSGKHIRRCALCYSIEVSNARRTADRLVWDGQTFRRATEEERAQQDLVRNSLMQKEERYESNAKKESKAQSAAKIHRIARKLAKQMNPNG